jgi:membrane-bound serine protease (ClpP class)
VNETWIFALMTAGVLFLALEIFVIPGVGLAGALGAVFLMAGAVGAFATFGPAGGVLTSLVALAAVSGAFFLVAKTRVGKALVHRSAQEPASSVPTYAELVDRRGRTLTPLRPSGIVRIGDAEIDVVTQGEYVDVGREVRVVEVEGGRVVVREVSS